MTSLVEGEDVVPVRKVETHEVPGVCRLVASVQQDDRRRSRLAPLEKAEPQSIEHVVLRQVTDVGRIPDSEFARACIKTSELSRRRHV